MLTRPVNVLISMLSILVAAVICGSTGIDSRIVAACLSGGLITAAANTINDYFDVEIDRINKPKRPLPAGVVSLRSARCYSLLLFVMGILTAFFVNKLAALVAAVCSFLLYFYSARLKRTVIFGNLTVSITTALAFIYGGIAAGQVKNALIPAVFAFFMHFGREIIKDMEDVQGDQQQNAITLPVKYGLPPAQRLATSVFMVLFLMTIVPFIAGIYGVWYLLIVLIGVNTVLLYTTIQLWRKATRTSFAQLSTILKADMMIGLFAIFAGRW